jgi:Tfp pilus assembly protein PilZ
MEIIWIKNLERNYKLKGVGLNFHNKYSNSKYKVKDQIIIR